MDNQTRWKIEEEHDDNMRQLNQAEEMLDDYQREMNQTTSRLVDYVYGFYRELDEPIPYSLSHPFEEVLENYNFDLRKKREEIEELRIKEQQSFNEKMDL
ncbi:hypothetical protein OGZ37_13070 [Lactococcus lactis]|uniref:hypothetical protein n=1 Tax=Lactococcus lactis TaxID=1358 RepID=UPI0024186E19|nr:hypothetical protein [Lactococcus lactis]MDG4967488.1 hypothetical protein [Lactococcus lactis]